MALNDNRFLRKNDAIIPMIFFRKKNLSDNRDNREAIIAISRSVLGPLNGTMFPLRPLSRIIAISRFAPGTDYGPMFPLQL